MSSDFRETLYTIDQRGHRKWVYPTEIVGFFKARRRIIASLLLAFYLLMPWISIGEYQAIHLDIFNRRFVFFGNVFWATDTKYLFLSLFTLGLTLFLFTSLFGRVWCGWACPQTVFLEFVFRPIEQLIEGSFSQRKKLDEQPWNLKKLRIKLTKYVIFIILAWFIANTFLAYFLGRERLIGMMTSSPLDNLSTFILSNIMTGVVLFEFGWFREQFCTVLCPYARFQSVLLDDSSVIVGYDAIRGEPRSKVSKSAGGEESPKGDCVDCGLCVRVCPTGIDIRNGLQLECVQCASCIDACDSIMTKLGRPLGLIRYDSEKGLKGDLKKLIRPRTVVYASVWLLVISVFGYLVLNRKLSEASIFHSRSGHLFSMSQVVGEEGIVVNHLELHIENKAAVVNYYTVEVDASMDSSLAGVKLVMPVNPFPVQPNKFQQIPLFAKFPKGILINGKRSIELIIKDNSSYVKRLKLDLLGAG